MISLSRIKDWNRGPKKRVYDVEMVDYLINNDLPLDDIDMSLSKADKHNKSKIKKGIK